MPGIYTNVGVCAPDALGVPVARQSFTLGVNLLKKEFTGPTTKHLGIPGPSNKVSTYYLFVVWHQIAMMTLTPPSQTDRNAAHSVVVPGESTHGRSGFEVPESRRMILAPGGELRPVRRVSEGVYLRPMSAQDAEQRPRLTVPHSHQLIVAPRRDPTAIRRERDAGDRAAVLGMLSGARLTIPPRVRKGAWRA